jgi:hypothetical protein
MSAIHHTSGTGAAKLDLNPRLSYVSGTSQTKDVEEGGYTGAKTPDGTPQFEGGALRPGEVPVLTSKDGLGLLFQYAAVGLNYGLLPATIYPLLMYYFNASGATISAAATLVVLPWSFKAFYGILTDCVPLFGYRRRPWMVIGWTICEIMLIVMACMPAGDPYFTNPDDRDVKVADYTPEIEARIYYDAPGQAGKYTILMFLAAVGYVLADVCADSIVVDFAQREPEAIRGKTQSMIYIVRTVLVIFGELISGFCFNGKEYGGDFNFSLTFPQVMIIMAVLTVPVIPMTWFFIKEEKHERANFGEYMKGLYDLICSRAMFQVIWYVLLANIFAGIGYTASSPLASRVVGVTPLNSTLSDILGNLLFLTGIAVTSKWGLQWNWRWMIVATGIVVSVVDCVTTMITVWDIFRSQWFWLGPPIAVQLPAGVGWMISNFVVVELAQQGNEAAVYGLLTTTHNVASPFATALMLVIDAPFNLTNDRIMTDDHDVRLDITYVVIIMYAMTFFSWVFLFLLPPQKHATQELVRTGGSNKLIGNFTIFVLFFAFVWSVMTNIMAIFDSTSCLVIAGGSGC